MRPLSSFPKQISSFCPDINYIQLLESCISTKNLTLGAQIHSKIITSGHGNDSLLSTKLITLYSQCHDVPSAKAIFTHFPNCNVFILNSMIRGLSSNGLNQEAINLFCIERREGVEPDSYTFSCVLKACASLLDVRQGRSLHQLVIQCGFESDLFVSNSLVAMYAKCGSLESGVQVFDRMPQRDVVSWNSIVAAYALNGLDYEAAERVREMVESGLKPDEATFVSVLTLSLNDESTVREMHGYVLRSGHEPCLMIRNALVSAYGKCGRVKEARRVFDSSIAKDRVSWNALIACYAQNGLFEESLGLLKEMKLFGIDMDVVTYSGIISSLSQNDLSSEAMMVFKELLRAGLKPDIVATASILPAISGALCLDYCKEIHAYSYRHRLVSDRRVKNALVSAYCNCGLVRDAERVFAAIDEKDVISWSSMVVGYTQNQCFLQGLNAFRQMVRSETEPNPVTITSVLSACAGVSGLQLAKELHSWATKNFLECQTFIGSALIDVYAKCGRIGDSRRVFDLMKEKNLVTWNSMIGGYAIHGLGEDALQLFYMLEKPDDVTCIAVLSACSHGGLVEEGIKIFNTMKDSNVTAREAHYACMVDLLARSGRIEQAADLAKTMPMKASAEIWGVILGASKMQADLEVGSYSGEQILESGSTNSGYYVLLSNMYADCGKWEEVGIMRDMMKEKGVKKGAGCSWIEVEKGFHCFVAKERAQHPEWETMFGVLTFLCTQMKEVSC